MLLRLKHVTRIVLMRHWSSDDLHRRIVTKYNKTCKVDMSLDAFAMLRLEYALMPWLFDVPLALVPNLPAEYWAMLDHYDDSSDDEFADLPGLETDSDAEGW